MKKVFALMLVLLLSVPAFADVASSLIADNPLPEIFKTVSPSVAVLSRVSNVWDAETGIVSKKYDGAGSAVLVADGGYFLTNCHVVKDCDELEISFGSDDIYEAYVIGYDEGYDVAVVKVDDELDLTPVKVGRSSDLQVGDIVLTIGTPLDESIAYNTLTAGIVSGLERNDADYDSSRAVDLIQIDAAINPGNSGGALLNLKGELVGIPFMKYMGYYTKDASGEEFVFYESLAFAIPIDAAWPIAESLIKTGSFNRPRFGVSVTDNEGPEEPLKNYPPAGLKIAEVEKNGSGFKAGLRVGDVITHVNGVRVYTFRDYTKIVDKLGVGESFTVTVARYNDENGEPLRKPVTLDLTVTLEMID